MPGDIKMISHDHTVPKGMFGDIKRIDILRLIDKTNNLPISKIETDKLYSRVGQSRQSGFSKQRLEKAEDFPILVTNTDTGLHILDGRHRIIKNKMQNKETTDVRFVPLRIIEESVIERY